MEKNLNDIIDMIKEFYNKYETTKIETKIIIKRDKIELSDDILNEFSISSVYKKYFCKYCKIHINNRTDLKKQINSNKHSKKS